MASQGFEKRSTEKRAVQKQHVEMHRKLLLRRRMLRWGREGACYVPFIGDGDIARELYRDRPLYGADLDPGRVQVAASRLHGATVIEADCDEWPFPGLDVTFSLADFDAYSSPYFSFRAFWENARKADELLLFFTDGSYMSGQRTGYWYTPAGPQVFMPLSSRDEGWERQRFTWQYFSRYVEPWFRGYIKPYEVMQLWKYRRMHVYYWAAAVKLPKTVQS